MTLNSYLSWHGYMLYYHNLRSHFMQFTERWMTTHYQFQLIGLDKFPNTVHGKGICRWMGSDSLHQPCVQEMKQGTSLAQRINPFLFTQLLKGPVCVKLFFVFFLMFGPFFSNKMKHRPLSPVIIVQLCFSVIPHFEDCFSFSSPFIFQYLLDIIKR